MITSRHDLVKLAQRERIREMPDDYVTAHNTKLLADEAKEADPPEVKVHDITKHQLFTHDGVKQVYHVDHTAGKVYIEGERGLLRYSGPNVEQVSQYPPYSESDNVPTQAYQKHVSQTGIVSYTDLAGQPYSPQEGDTEYYKNDAGLFVKVMAPGVEQEPDTANNKKSKSKDKE